MKKISIQKLTFDHFTNIIPAEELSRTLEYYCGKREVKHFWNYMRGQTMSILERQAGVYAIDIQRFLKYRRINLAGKKMPLDD